MLKKFALSIAVLSAILSVPSAIAADPSCDQPKKEPADGCKIPKGSLVVPSTISLKRSPVGKKAIKPVKKKPVSR